MTPIDNPALENLHQRTAQMLTAIDSTRLSDIDHVHYEHYYEELRLLVEEWLTATKNRASPLPDQTWVVTHDGLPIGLCTTDTATALAAGLEGLTFTPDALYPSVIDDLRERWIQDQCRTNDAPELP